MKKISRRAFAELDHLQSSLQEVASLRRTAVQLLLMSRDHATQIAQRDFWLEFAWIHQEYRMALSRLAQFCLLREGAGRARGRGESS